MCPCDKQAGHVCGYCTDSIRNSLMPTDMRRAYYGGWKVAAVEAVSA